MSERSSEHLIRYHQHQAQACRLEAQSAELKARALDKQADAHAAYADHLTESQLWAIEAEEAARRG
jgi:hypothetical protein